MIEEATNDFFLSFLNILQLKPLQISRITFSNPVLEEICDIYSLPFLKSYQLIQIEQNYKKYNTLYDSLKDSNYFFPFVPKILKKILELFKHEIILQQRIETEMVVYLTLYSFLSWTVLFEKYPRQNGKYFPLIISSLNCLILNNNSSIINNDSFYNETIIYRKLAVFSMIYTLKLFSLKTDFSNFAVILDPIKKFYEKSQFLPDQSFFLFADIVNGLLAHNKKNDLTEILVFINVNMMERCVKFPQKATQNLISALLNEIEDLNIYSLDLFSNFSQFLDEESLMPVCRRVVDGILKELTKKPFLKMFFDFCEAFRNDAHNIKNKFDSVQSFTTNTVLEFPNCLTFEDGFNEKNEFKINFPDAIDIGQLVSPSIQPFLVLIKKSNEGNPKIAELFLYYLKQKTNNFDSAAIFIFISVLFNHTLSDLTFLFDIIFQRNIITSTSFNSEAKKYNDDNITNQTDFSSIENDTIIANKNSYNNKSEAKEKEILNIFSDVVNLKVDLELEDNHEIKNNITNVVLNSLRSSCFSLMVNLSHGSLVSLLSYSSSSPHFFAEVLLRCKSHIKRIEVDIIPTSKFITAIFRGMAFLQHILFEYKNSKKQDICENPENLVNSKEADNLILSKVEHKKSRFEKSVEEIRVLSFNFIFELFEDISTLNFLVNDPLFVNSIIGFLFETNIQSIILEKLFFHIDEKIVCENLAVSLGNLFEILIVSFPLENYVYLANLIVLQMNKTCKNYNNKSNSFHNRKHRHRSSSIRNEETNQVDLNNLNNAFSLCCPPLFQAVLRLDSSNSSKIFFSDFLDFIVNICSKGSSFDLTKDSCNCLAEAIPQIFDKNPPDDLYINLFNFLLSSTTSSFPSSFVNNSNKDFEAKMYLIVHPNVLFILFNAFPEKVDELISIVDFLISKNSENAVICHNSGFTDFLIENEKYYNLFESIAHHYCTQGFIVKFLAMMKPHASFELPNKFKPLLFVLHNLTKYEFNRIENNKLLESTILNLVPNKTKEVSVNLNGNNNNINVNDSVLLSIINNNNNNFEKNYLKIGFSFLFYFTSQQMSPQYYPVVFTCVNSNNNLAANSELGLNPNQNQNQKNSPNLINNTVHKNYCEVFIVLNKLHINFDPNHNEKSLSFEKTLPFDKRCLIALVFTKDFIELYIDSRKIETIYSKQKPPSLANDGSSIVSVSSNYFFVPSGKIQHFSFGGALDRSITPSSPATIHSFALYDKKLDDFQISMISKDGEFSLGKNTMKPLFSNIRPYPKLFSESSNFNNDVTCKLQNSGNERKNNFISILVNDVKFESLLNLFSYIDYEPHFGEFFDIMLDLLEMFLLFEQGNFVESHIIGIISHVFVNTVKNSHLNYKVFNKMFSTMNKLDNEIVKKEFVQTILLNFNILIKCEIEEQKKIVQICWPQLFVCHPEIFTSCLNFSSLLNKTALFYYNNEEMRKILFDFFKLVSFQNNEDYELMINYVLKGDDFAMDLISSFKYIIHNFSFYFNCFANPNLNSVFNNFGITQNNSDFFGENKNSNKSNNENNSSSKITTQCSNGDSFEIDLNSIVFNFYYLSKSILKPNLVKLNKQNAIIFCFDFVPSFHALFLINNPTIVEKSIEILVMMHDLFLIKKPNLCEHLSVVFKIIPKNLMTEKLYNFSIKLFLNENDTVLAPPLIMQNDKNDKNNKNDKDKNKEINNQTPKNNVFMFCCLCASNLNEQYSLMFIKDVLFKESFKYPLLSFSKTDMLIEAPLLLIREENKDIVLDFLSKAFDSSQWKLIIATINVLFLNINKNSNCNNTLKTNSIKDVEELKHNFLMKLKILTKIDQICFKEIASDFIFFKRTNKPNKSLKNEYKKSMFYSQERQPVKLNTEMNNPNNLDSSLNNIQNNFVDNENDFPHSINDETVAGSQRFIRFGLRIDHKGEWRDSDLALKTLKETTKKIQNPNSSNKNFSSKKILSNLNSTQSSKESINSSNEYNNNNNSNFISGSVDIILISLSYFLLRSASAHKNEVYSCLNKKNNNLVREFTENQNINISEILERIEVGSIIENEAEVIVDHNKFEKRVNMYDIACINTFDLDRVLLKEKEKMQKEIIFDTKFAPNS